MVTRMMEKKEESERELGASRGVLIGSSRLPGYLMYEEVGTVVARSLCVPGRLVGK